MPRISHQLLDCGEKPQMILCIHKNLYKESMKLAIELRLCEVYWEDTSGDITTRDFESNLVTLKLRIGSQRAMTTIITARIAKT